MLFQSYTELIVILLWINFSISLIISLYYFWRYSKTKAKATLLWAIGFFGTFLGFLLYYFFEYIYHDLVTTALPNWDYESAFLTGGILIISSCLSMSTFYFTGYTEKVKKLGLFTIAIIAFITMVLLIINSFILFDVFKIINWICRGFTIYVAGFFLVYSLKEKIYRALLISISLIFAFLGGVLMASDIDFLVLLGNIIQFIFWALLSLGLYYVKKNP